MILPAVLVFSAFFIIPFGVLLRVGAQGAYGIAGYWLALMNPEHLESLVATLVLSTVVTVATLCLGGVCGVFLGRNRFPGHGLMVSILTLPLAFPGVVVGFMIIMLAGRQGLVSDISLALHGGRIVFAYSAWGLFLGYLYFSIPRVLLTVMASAEILDASLEEAARSLGAKPARVFLDVTLPALKPALISAGALTFATSMGAFGTAFTLATRINVLPMMIYTDFTLSTDLSSIAALSLLLGLISWVVLSLARSVAGSGVAAAG
ncbi:ABC transporter permease [Acidocella aminolytica]|uniref:ABC transporter permease n=2 Tax=Acidocella TaxID=50709 RepID=A0A0D6PIX3_9PROT|nr:ABC transporter permease [Acidocella aminolytica]GAN80769.1 ABC transporter permease [Acidocella aminolytica 101 = DSM 11237]SHF51828.1 putative spermidine/putrescine transport system permease protein [Acidocella aminolytica 101 = DSM 11237]